MSVITDLGAVIFMVEPPQHPWRVKLLTLWPQVTVIKAVSQGKNGEGDTRQNDHDDDFIGSCPNRI